MKRLAFLNLLIVLFSAQVFSANFKSGDEVRIENAEDGDYYLAGGEIEILTPIYGDLVIGGGEVDVNDSVFGDILAGCGRINVNGYVGDDIRISGGDVYINQDVAGDVFVFAGTLRISEDAHIMGDLVTFGGEVTLYGQVDGDLKCYSGNLRLKGQVGGDAEIKTGNVKFDGAVAGDMEIASENIDLGNDASCSGSIRYWQSEGELDFEGVCDDVTYDDELAFADEEWDYSVLSGMLGIGLVVYWIIFVLSSVVVIWLLQVIFGPYFEIAAREIRKSFIKSFGYGMIYLLGIPILILIAFITIIGFPIGVLALSIYGISLLFATAVIGLLVSHYFRNKSGQDWSDLQTIMYAILTVIILKIIFMIPILGQTLKTLSMAAVYGTFLLMLIEGSRRDLA